MRIRCQRCGDRGSVWAESAKGRPIKIWTLAELRAAPPDPDWIKCPDCDGTDWRNRDDTELQEWFDKQGHP